jgi:ketosteroid isomerase-like protein
LEKRRGIVAGIIALSCLTSGCSKTGKDDSRAASAPAPAAAMTDHASDAATINRLDSAWMRYIIAKNVDSIMTQYSPDAVTYYPETPAAAGADEIRSAYSQMTKMQITEARVVSNSITFSDDGSLAVDHGTSIMTATAPGGKSSTMNGAYVNVWKKSGGTWKIVVDMSEPTVATSSEKETSKRP